MRFICFVECKQYEEAKYEVYWSGGVNDKPVSQKVARCTMSTVPFVVGGEVADPHEFPHMVYIEFEPKFSPLAINNGISNIEIH